MPALIAAVIAWIALHAIVAGPLRPPLAVRLGERGFRALFALASLACLIGLIATYRAAPYVELWAAPTWARTWAFVLMVPAFVLLVLALGPNPTAVGGRPGASARGVFRITRHPMLNAFALWAIAHLPANGDLATVLLLFAIFATALNGMASIDRKRARALGRAWDEFARTTSRLPFVAIAQGRNRFEPGEISWGRVVAGLVAYGAALWLHGMAGPALL